MNNMVLGVGIISYNRFQYLFFTSLLFGIGTCYIDEKKKNDMEEYEKNYFFKNINTHVTKIERNLGKRRSKLRTIYDFNVRLFVVNIVPTGRLQ